ncbi:MAG: hypothetical protein LBF68_03330 [Christensenellaceae bacterium]|jgi:uncharacterized FAD-dependent dehydrogenase|nr:hypothetical protein [Christensenellaceae bacterium]
MGLRIEHKQCDINKSQYGAHYDKLPAADYKLSAKLSNNRYAYTFCMCPGGEVVQATPESGCCVTNGMSYFARDLKNSNSAILVNVNPEDFGSSDPLAGLEFQRKYERIAFDFSRDYRLPTSRLHDFLINKTPLNLGSIRPSCKRGAVLANLNECLPTYISDGIKEGIKIFNNKVKGFENPDAILSGIESRSSTPVRILRDDKAQSISCDGLYPVGEGSGYSGGIMSSAVDGIKTAINIINGINSK